MRGRESSCALSDFATISQKRQDPWSSIWITPACPKIADHVGLVKSCVQRRFYHEKKVLQLHICWSFCFANFLCVAEKTCNAKIIRENKKE